MEIVFPLWVGVITDSENAGEYGDAKGPSLSLLFVHVNLLDLDKYVEEIGRAHV